MQALPSAAQLVSRARGWLADAPLTLRLELTNHCNLRCKMCGIWAEHPKRTLAPSFVGAVLADPVCRHLRLVSLTGGEPFMLPELGEYYRAVRRTRPSAHVNISSNGFYTDQTLAFFADADVGTVSLTISYDGLRSHDTVRGVGGSAERLLRTAVAVRDQFPWVPLSLKLTVTNDNYSEITDTAAQSQALGIPFRFKTLEALRCHQSRFPSEVSGPDYAPQVRARIVSQAERLRTSGHQTNRRYLRTLTEKFSGAATPCACSPRTLFLGIDGALFLCRKKSEIGNVFDASIGEVWRSSTRVGRQGDMRACLGDPHELSYGHD